MAVSQTSLVSAWPAVRSRELFYRRQADGFYPFSSPVVQYFYFARNAIWHAVHLLKLAGKEILVPAYHHGVEVQALLHAGARVRFFRVDSRMNVDVEDIERKITPQTGAILLIHYLGFPGPVAAVQRLAEKYGLPWIEDCALAFLSSENGRYLGSSADASVFSFYKTVPIPHGGALVFNRSVSHPRLRLTSPPFDSTLSHFASSFLLANPELGDMGRRLHRLLQPMGKAFFSTIAKIPRVDTGTMHFDPAHVNLGMSLLARHMLRASDLTTVIARRRKNFLLLLNELASVAPPVFDHLPAGVCPLFYPLVAQDKDRVREQLLEKGITTIDFWRFAHPDCPGAEFPESVQLRNSIIELPCHQDLSEETIRWMALEIKRVLAPSVQVRKFAG